MCVLYICKLHTKETEISQKRNNYFVILNVIKQVVEARHVNRYYVFPLGRLPIMSMLGKNANGTESAATIRAQIGVYITLSILSFLLNGTFLMVIWRNWKFVKGRRITYHVTNLAISDFIVGMSTFCHYISIVAADGETAVSSAFTTIVWTATLTSLLAVCLMAIERAVCIMKPHTWNQILPLNRVLMVMAGNWVVTLVLAIIMHFYTMKMMFTLLVLFNIPIIVTTVVYTSMYIKITKTKSKEDETKQKCPEAKGRKSGNKLMERKVANVVLILTLVLLTTVTPSFLVVSIKIACEAFELNCAFIETVTILSHYIYMLEIVNFVVNPILYVWRISMYRQAFWRLLGRPVDSDSSQGCSSSPTNARSQLEGYTKCNITKCNIGRK